MSTPLNRQMDQMADAQEWKERAVATEAKLARCVEALARLAGTPAVRMALGEKHTDGCPCPLCDARAALAAAKGGA